MWHMCTNASWVEELDLLKIDIKNFNVFKSHSAMIVYREGEWWKQLLNSCLYKTRQLHLFLICAQF